VVGLGSGGMYGSLGEASGGMYGFMVGWPTGASVGLAIGDVGVGAIGDGTTGASVGGIPSSPFKHLLLNVL
jgi:hypothetical protein